jgi:hypothetical protein
MDQDERRNIRDEIDQAVARERAARIQAERDLTAERDKRTDERFADLVRELRDMRAFYDQRFKSADENIRTALEAARSGPPWQMVIGALVAIATLIALLALLARGAI